MDTINVLLACKPAHDYKRVQVLLESLQCRVQTANSSKIALKLLESDPEIDLVLVEGCEKCEMTEAFLATLHKDHRLSNLPCLVIGTELTSDIVRTYIELGVQDIILMPTHQETLEAKIHTAMKSGKPRILVVDDEPAIREILADFLILERCRPITAGSAEEASELLKGTEVDLVISDIKMPGRSGLQLMVEVKEDRPNLPVILITGHAGKYTPKDAIAMGADGYFAKPFHNMDLVYTLRRVLTRGRRRLEPVPA